MKLDVQLIKDLYDTLAFDEAPSGDDKTDAEVYRKHHNKLIQSLSLLEHIAARNAVLEAAVAWHGFDELPQCEDDIEFRYAGGDEVEICKGTFCEGTGLFVCPDASKLARPCEYNQFDEYDGELLIKLGFTGWRYPVGDLTALKVLEPAYISNFDEYALPMDLPEVG